MPKKGTKKVREHTRRDTLVDVGDIKVKDITNSTKVKEHYRSKPKKKK